MSSRVVVVGAGYAGTAIVQDLDGDRDIDLTWISATDYHLVKHEIHRIIRSPAVAAGLQVPAREIASDAVEFRRGKVVSVEPNDQRVRLGSGDTVSYDILVLTAGARTAYYGIPGLRDHARTLTGIEDARAINSAITSSTADPLRVVVGGGGLTGVQIAGEIDALVTDFKRSVDITIVEALEDLLPHGPPSLRDRIVSALAERNVGMVTGSPIVEVTADSVVLDGERDLPWDVLVWSGGITGTDIELGGGIETARNRVAADRMLRTSDPRVFAFGDAAVINQPTGVAPPTAQAAWQAATIAASNVRAAIAGDPLREWTFTSKGTLISVGDDAFAHGVRGLPIETVGSYPAAALKKAVAARWIADVDSWSAAASLWRTL